MSFKHVSSDNQGFIYAVTTTGDILFYRDQARDGTINWAHGGVGQKIGSGWADFLRVFAGGDGIIYAVAQNGDLMYYRDLARDGTINWAYGGIGQKIGSGWGGYRRIVGGDAGVIYAVAESGPLLYYRDLARDGTMSWSHDGVGQTIGSGWQGFVEVLSGGLGIIYAITADGVLLYYRDLAQSGVASWAYNGQGQKIGGGWFVHAGPTGAIEGYCAPLSGAPGDVIQFQISAPNGCTIQYLRLKQQPDGSVGAPMGSPVSVGPSSQTTAPEAWANGCGWSTTVTLTIPAGWQSGIYAAHCTDSYGGDYYIVFIVKPAPAQRRQFAVLANTNTWNAYNDWGGRSKYSAPPGATLSFARPNLATSPVGSGLNHLTRAELWVLNWLEDAGYGVDVYSDHDFHTGIAGLSGYKALLFTTHPEYWTAGMMSNLEAYLGGGGHVLYLGGNGLFEEVAFNAAGDAITLLQGDPRVDRARCYFRNLSSPRPERAILGVAYRYDNYMTFGPYQVLQAGHRFFAGTNLMNGDLIGQEGINGGSASGWEMDTSIAGTAQPGVIVGAGSAADDRGAPPANLQLLARGTNSGYGADMTYYDTPSGGFVFCTGSLSFGGSLVVDAQLQAILRNVLDECEGQ